MARESAVHLSRSVCFMCYICVYTVEGRGDSGYMWRLGWMARISCTSTFNSVPFFSGGHVAEKEIVHTSGGRERAGWPDVCIEERCTSCMLVAHKEREKI